MLSRSYFCRRAFSWCPQRLFLPIQRRPASCDIPGEGCRCCSLPSSRVLYCCLSSIFCSFSFFSFYIAPVWSCVTVKSLLHRLHAEHVEREFHEGMLSAIGQPLKTMIGTNIQLVKFLQVKLVDR